MALRSFADGALFGEAWGEGSPRILALHGWGRRAADFKRALHDLPALALDLPGFGASPAPKNVIGADGYADIVAEVLGDLDGPLVLVGHSFGGRVAVCLAAKNPEAVSSLVLTGVPLLRTSPPRKPALRYRVIRGLHRLGVISDERLETERRNRGSADYRAAEGVMRDILVKVVNEEYPEQLSQIEASVHLLWGENDQEVPIDSAIAADALIEHSRLEVLPNVGHHVPIEAPEALRKAVEEQIR